VVVAVDGGGSEVALGTTDAEGVVFAVFERSGPWEVRAVDRAGGAPVVMPLEVLPVPRQRARLAFWLPVRPRASRADVARSRPGVPERRGPRSPRASGLLRASAPKGRGPAQEMTFSTRSFTVRRSCTPEKRSTSLPPLKKMQVGTPWIPKCPAAFGALSMSTL
jgi:hypothetical protein